MGSHNTEIGESAGMTIEDLKQECLENIDKEAQLENAEKLAGNNAGRSYHSGRKEVWLDVHTTLVHFFTETGQKKQLPVDPPRPKGGLHEVG